jgi:hypothetical protein
MESTLCNEQMGKAKGDKLDKRFCIHIHSRRRRLCDPDGVSGKAAIDGLAKGGIFPDDSAKYIKTVSYSQEITKEDEETIIDVYLES